MQPVGLEITLYAQLLSCCACSSDSEDWAKSIPLPDAVMLVMPACRPLLHASLILMSSRQQSGTANPGYGKMLISGVRVSKESGVNIEKRSRLSQS